MGVFSHLFSLSWYIIVMKYFIVLVILLIPVSSWYTYDNFAKRDQDLQNSQAEIDLQYEKEAKIFSKFTLDFPRRFVDFAYDDTILALQFYQKFTFNLIKYTLPFAKNKTDYLNFFYAFVDYPHRFDHNDLSHYVFSELFNRHKAKYSIFSFAQVRQHIQKYPLYQRILDREFVEHSNVIRFTANILDEFAVGDFLLGVIKQSDQKDPSYRALRILKAWDTHWQEFAQISAKDLSLIDFPDQALSITNKKLRLSLNILSSSQQTDQKKFAITTFELQKDRSRKLVSCSPKSPKIWSWFCADQQISIRTLLDD